MRVEMVAGFDNVVRFPAERRARPTLELLWELEPDVRWVVGLAETFELEMPDYTLSDTADAEAAGYIAGHIPAFGPERRMLLDELLEAALARAATACQDARDASADVAEAEARLAAAQASGGYWLDEMRTRIDGLALQMAKLSVVAHALAEEAKGVARAVRLARSGEAWTPRDFDADFEALLALRRTGS